MPSVSCCPHPGQPGLGLDGGDGFRNLSTVGPAPVYGRRGSHELSLRCQSPQTHKLYLCWGMLPGVFGL